MKLVNIDYIPGKEFEAIGLVKGTVVYSKNVGRDFMASMKTLVGGEIKGYTKLFGYIKYSGKIIHKKLIKA
mgnify:CR=1 FL=1